jgi:hypothetical protein
MTNHGKLLEADDMLIEVVRDSQAKFSLAIDSTIVKATAPMEDMRHCDEV